FPSPTLFRSQEGHTRNVSACGFMTISRGSERASALDAHGPGRLERHRSTRFRLERRRARAGDAQEERAHQNLEVHPEGAVLHVVEVVLDLLDLFLEVVRVSVPDLRQPERPGRTF